MSHVTRLMQKKLRDLNLREIRVRVFDGGLVVEGLPQWGEAQDMVIRKITEEEIALDKYQEKVMEAAQRPIAVSAAPSIEEALMTLEREAEV